MAEEEERRCTSPLVKECGEEEWKEALLHS
jgi:hypothetical protein